MILLNTKKQSFDEEGWRRQKGMGKLEKGEEGVPKSR